MRRWEVRRERGGGGGEGEREERRIGMIEKGEKGMRRGKGSEKMGGVLKKLLSVLALQSGVVFILKYFIAHTHTLLVRQFAQHCTLPLRPPGCSEGQGTGRETECLSRCCCNSAAVPVMTSRSV